MPKKSATVHVRQQDLAGETSTDYPPELQQQIHWKVLFGGMGQDSIPSDAMMGTLTIEPGCDYRAHFHPAPELYYLIRGNGTWTVDGASFEVGPGSAIYHAPMAVHRMVNDGDQAMQLVWFWWAPGGRRQVLEVGPMFDDAAEGPLDRSDVTPS